MSDPADMVVCETVAAITPHLRRVGRGLPPIRLGGHPDPRPFALCGTPIAWDTELPIDAARCSRCLRVAGRVWAEEPA